MKVTYLVGNCCDEFEQVNGGCLMLYASTQLHGSINLKSKTRVFNLRLVMSHRRLTKLNLKVEEICTDCSPDFL